MFSALKRGLGLFSQSPARLLRFSLNNALRPYLKDELQQDNFEVQLWQGIVNIENIELDELALNKKLNGFVPVRIDSVRIGKLTMDVPWRKVVSEHVQVIVQDVEIRISLFEDVPDLDVNVGSLVDKCVTKSVEVLSQEELIKEEVEEDLDSEELGIESVEELFENIFSNMNLSLHHVTLYITNRQRVVKFSIKNMDMTNQTGEPVKDFKGQRDNIKKESKVKKAITIGDTSVDIIAPQESAGSLFGLTNKNTIYISYAKGSETEANELELDIDVSQSPIESVLTKQQFDFINNFLKDTRTQNKEPQIPAVDESDEEDESLYESTENVLANSSFSFANEQQMEIDEESMDALQRSILFYAPYGTPTKRGSEPTNLSLKFHLQTLNFKLRPKIDQDQEFILQVNDLTLQLRNTTHKMNNDITLYNLTISNINKTRVTPILSSIQSTKKIVPIRCQTETTRRFDGETTDIKVSLPPIRLFYSYNYIDTLSKFFGEQEALPKTKLKTVPSLTNLAPPSPRITHNIFNIKLPHIHLIVDLPKYTPKQTVQALELDMIDLKISTIPSTLDTTSKLFVEFSSISTFFQLSEDRKRPFISIWTTDPDDRPRLEITSREPTPQSSQPIHCMMIDPDAIFSPPLFFSYLSKDCKQIVPINYNGAIDLERTKQFSAFLLDIVFPCVQLELDKTDFSLIGGLLADFSSDAKSASSIMATIGKANLILREKSKDNISIEHFIDLNGFSCFQGTVYDRQQMPGTFFFSNVKDAQLSDNENAIILRSIPNQLQMAEQYCAPFAINFPVFNMVINGSTFTFQQATLGLKPSSISKFISFFTSSDEEVKEEKREDVPKEKSTTKVEVTALNSSIYYQPFSTEPLDASISTVPPRAILLVESLKLTYTDQFKVSFDGLRFWIKEDFHYARNSDIWLDFSHPDPVQHLRNKSLIEVILLPYLDLDISWKEDSSTEINLRLLRPNDEQTANPLVISVKPDSFETLGHILGTFGPDLALQFASAEPEPSPQKIVHDQPDLSSVMKIVEDYQPEPNANRTGNPKKQKKSPPKKKVPQSSSDQQPSPKPSAYILFDESEDSPVPPRQSHDKDNRVNSTGFKEDNTPLADSWEWIDDSGPEPAYPDMEEEESVFSPLLALASSIKIQNLVVLIRMLGGHDWDNPAFHEQTTASRYRRNKAIEAPMDSIEIQLDIPFIQFDSFAANQRSDWRLAIEVRRMMIDDKVHTSHHAKILTFTRRVEKKPTQKNHVIRVICEQTRSGSYKLKLVINPLRLYLDQDTLTFIGDFFTYSSQNNPKKSEPQPTGHVLFDYFDLSEIDSVVDYKPRNTLGSVYNDIRVGNNVWAIKMVELNKASIKLSRIKLFRVNNSSDLLQSMLASWIKDFKSSGVYSYLYGTLIAQPVQIGVNIGSAVIDLIKTPVEEYNKGGNVLRGIGAGATSFATKLTVELLNISASSAIAIKKGLRGIDKVIGGQTPAPTAVHISNYANQPESIGEAAQLAATNFKSGITNSLDAISRGGIWSIPSAIIQPAIGSLSAFSNLALGFRNSLDSTELEKSKEKYKTGDQQDINRRSLETPSNNNSSNNVNNNNNWVPPSNNRYT